MKISTEENFQWSIRIIAGALVFSLFLGSKIWVTARDFPVLPFIDLIPAIPAPIDYALYCITVAAACVLLIYPLQARLVWATTSLLLFLMLFDQMRWQPNIIFYLFGLSALSLSYKNKEAGLNIIRAMLIFWFIWSGIQELNPVFKNYIFPWLFGPVISFFPKAAAPLFVKIAYLFPVLKILTGIGLLLPNQPFKKYIIYTGVGLHLLMTYALGPLGNSINYSYLPYHIIGAALVYLLFNEHPIDIKTLFINRKFWLSIPVTLLMGALPVLSFAGKWDTMQSYMTFSGKVKYGKLYIPDDMTGRLPDSIKNQLKRMEATPYVEITLWSLEVLDVPAYAEERVYNQIRNYVCQYDTAATCRVQLVTYSY